MIQETVQFFQENAVLLVAFGFLAAWAIGHSLIACSEIRNGTRRRGEPYNFFM